LSTSPTALRTDPVLREKLFTYYIENSTSQELAEWLRGLEQDARGTLVERKAKVRQHSKYLTMPPEGFPSQTMSYLGSFTSEHLGEICEDLGLDSEGIKDARLRRIMREVRYREGWVPRPDNKSDLVWSAGLVAPFIEFYPIVKRGERESDFYDTFEDEMEGVFGAENVHAQLAIAYGNSLRIDFHLGHPQREGVGVEWKMPGSTSDVQRAIGQMEQYRDRYADRLILVLVPDFIGKTQTQMFTDQATAKGITVVVK
jgi:hypothetical protein